MRVELSPMDYYFYRPQLYTIQFAFEYEKRVSLVKINEGILRLLKYMPMAGARLVKASDFKLVLETGYEIPVREQVLTQEPDDPGKLFDTVINQDGEPLIRILITQKEKGSVVGISFSHLLGDGTSFFLFMKGLSQAILSEEFNITIHSDRSKLIDQVDTSGKFELFDSTGYIRPRPSNPDKVSVEYLSYSNRDLEEMKKACQRSHPVISSNVIIMADLIRRFHKNIPLFDNRLLVRCPVDYRKIIGLEENYFGNAVRDAVAVFHPEEIAQMDLPSIAGRIKDSINGVDRYSVQKSLSALDSYRRSNGINAFQELGCPGLLVSNLSNFPVAKIDLGEGSPINFQHASLNPRVAFIIKGQDGLVVKFKRPLIE